MAGNLKRKLLFMYTVLGMLLIAPWLYFGTEALAIVAIFGGAIIVSAFIGLLWSAEKAHKAHHNQVQVSTTPPHS